MIEAQIAALGSARNRSKKRLQMALWAPCGRPSAGSTPKTYKMVGNILDTHLLATLTRAVYAKSPSQWMKSVITRYFFRTLYLLSHTFSDVRSRQQRRLSHQSHDDYHCAQRTARGAQKSAAVLTRLSSSRPRHRRRRCCAPPAQSWRGPPRSAARWCLRRSCP